MTGNKPRRLRALATAVILILAAITAGAGTVAATPTDTENSVIDSLFAGEQTNQSLLETALQKATELKSFTVGFLTRTTPFGTEAPDGTAKEYAQRTAKTFNGNASLLANWTNNRVSATTEQNVIRFKYTDKEGGTHLLYIVADVNTSTDTYENPRALNKTEFENTGKTVDLHYTLTPYASRHANMELQNFIREYASDGETPPRTYLTHLAGEYRGQITGSDLPGTNANTDTWIPFVMTPLPGVMAT